MKRISIFILSLIFSVQTFSQQFEKPKADTNEFEKLKVKVGADFAIQLQAIDHEADVELIDLKNNFNLPTANLNITADLAPGIRLYINNYMSNKTYFCHKCYDFNDEVKCIESINAIAEHLLNIKNEYTKKIDSLIITARRT